MWMVESFPYLTRFWSAQLVVLTPPLRDTSSFGGDLRLLELPIFVIIGIFIATIAHESGHAMCGSLAGIRTRLVSIGRGPIVARFRVSYTQVVVRQQPISGAVYPYPPLIVEKGKLLFYALGGAFGNLVALVLIVGASKLLPESAILDASFVAAMQFVTMIGNLIPFRADKTPSDGLQILHLLRLPAKALTAAGVSYATRRAIYVGGESSPMQRPAESSVIAYYLDCPEIYTSRGVQRDFLKVARRALARVALAPDEQMIILDALVSVGVISRAPDYLRSLDEWSERALALNPGHPTLRASRGEALITLGRYAEGTTLLASIDAKESPLDFAISRLFLAKAQVALGGTDEARRLIRAARSVDGVSLTWEPLATMIRDIEAALGAAPRETETGATAT